MDILFVGLRQHQESAGVAAKLRAQLAALEQLGHRVHYTLLDESGCWLCRGDEKRLLCRYKRYQPAAMRDARNNAAMLLAAARLPDVRFDMAYIRKPLCDAAHLRALRLLKARGTAIAEEIPTFPYDEELLAAGGFGARVFLAIDRRHRKKLPRYVDCFPNFNRLDTIWGTPAIPLENMVAVDALAPHAPPPNTGDFSLIAVGAMLFWHGFDRAIKGLSNYVRAGGSRRVVLHLAGDGPQRAEWEALAATLGVGDNVVFHGTVTGPALDVLFNRCHMAVSTLGWHRRGFALSSALKTREYIARGIPFVYASDDTAATGVARCCVQIPGDDSPVDIPALLDFYAGTAGAGCTGAMRGYARQHLQWAGQMQKVVVACTGGAAPQHAP